MGKKSANPDNEMEEVGQAAKDDAKRAEDSDDGEKQKRRRKRKRKRKEATTDDKGSDNEEHHMEKEDDATTMPVTTLNEDDEKKAQEINRTIYMEGIPFSCTEVDVREFFASQGLKELSDVRLPVWQDSGRLRGYGHVVFPTVEQQQTALKLDQKYMGNRYISIQAANLPRQSSESSAPRVDPNHNPSRTLILGNLSYQAVEQDVFEVMKQFGTIVDGGVRVVRHSDTGRPKGFCYVEFESQNAAMRVVQKGHVVICDRSCRVDYDHGRVRGSFRTADRKLWHKEYHTTNKRKNYHGDSSKTSSNTKRQRS